MNVTPDLLFYPFEDVDWRRKFLIGGLLAAAAVLVPVIGWALAVPLAGYMLLIVRRTAETGTPSLPEWDDWGDLFRRGLRAWVVTLVYLLPALLLLCVAIGLMLVVIPVSLTGSDAAILSATLIGQFGGMFLLGVSMIPLLFLTYLLLVAQTRLAVADDLSAAFQFGEVWALARRGFRPFMLALIVLFGFTYLLSFVYTALIYTFVLLCLAPVAMAALSFYTVALSGALAGLAYRAADATPAGAASPSETAA